MEEQARCRGLIVGGNDGKRLLALTDIQTDGGFTQYRAGDFLPPEHPDAQAWVEAGSAKLVDADYEPPTYARARSITAPAGLPGLAVGGEATGDDLVGRVPMTRERMRGKWRA